VNTDLLEYIFQEVIMAKVGIPRALFFWYYYPLWSRFFENLGAEVVVSPPTNKSILDSGVKCAVDEACLPVKVYYGHVISLCKKAEYIFTPRLVSIERKAYICPKLMGLPDMIRWNVDNLPVIIDTVFDLSKKETALMTAVRETGRFFVSSDKLIDAAWADAEEYQKKYESQLSPERLPIDLIYHLETGKELARSNGNGDLFLAVVGHAYNIYDEYISMGLIRNLRKMGVRVITPDIIPVELSDHFAAKLPKRMFWTLGKRLLGSVLNYIHENEIDGMLYVEAFGCGPDSMIEDLSQRYVRRSKTIPFQVLTLDEHSGEAGVLTRLEAFVDMIGRRRVS